MHLLTSTQSLLYDCVTCTNTGQDKEGSQQLASIMYAFRSNSLTPKPHV